MSVPSISIDNTHMEQVPRLGEESPSSLVTVPVPVATANTGPRFITAEEVLIERSELRRELGYVPHGTGRGWSSMLWVSCDCPKCRDY